MNLFRESLAAGRWVAAVTRAFFRVRPWTTLTLVLSITSGKIASLLAFFLPLKVILLAGSDGVPRYFRFFIEPADKMPWIIGLSAAAVGFYALSLIATAVSKRLAEAGSSEVLQGANEIAVASKQREEAQGYYRRFSGISANILLMMLTFGILGWINPPLLTLIVVLVLAEALFTGGVLAYGNPLSPGATQRMIRRNLDGYLTIFSSVNFLSGFFVILIPFLIGAGGNLLVAILSILLLRQGLGAVGDAVAATTNLWNRRAMVDPMVFRSRQIQKREKLVTRNLREVFGKKAREVRARSELVAAGHEVESINSEWRDSTIKGVYTFHLRLRMLESEKKAEHFQQQVFPRGQLHLLEHEEYLFKHISRVALHAPEVRARYSDGPFACQICEYGQGKAVDGDRWKGIDSELMTHMWAFKPPKSLIRAFNTSRPTLEGRLTPGYLERLDVALDRAAEQVVYDELLQKLSGIQAVLAAIPVYIYNPDMIRANVAMKADGTPQVMTWGRWAIEPIGAALPKSMQGKVLDSVVATIRERRSLGEEQLQPNHVRLASDCREFEREIAKGRYNRAIVSMRRVLKNPLVQELS